MRGYRANTAFDGERAMPDGVLVLVDGDTIADVRPGSAPAPDGCEVTYLAGTTLLPGLVDAHVHLCADSGPNALDRVPDHTAGELDAVIDTALRAQLAAGVTAVRDLGDHHWAVVERRRVSPAGPTVVASGPPLTSVGGHCWTMGGEVRGPDELRRAVRERAGRGADVVKIMTSGGAMTAGTDVLACQFTLEEVRLVVAEAHRLGLPVTAHAHGLPAVEQCVAAGVDGIEHGTCLTADGIRTPPELVEAIAAAGMYVCTTLGRDLDALGGVMPPQVRAVMERTGMTYESRIAHYGALYRGGVTLVSGADAGLNPGKRHGVLPLAVADLVTAGVPAESALASATSVAARACGLADRTGRLRAGLDADLLIVDGDPARDIGALRAVRAVVSRGREVDLAVAP
jgi:imidazolonepropionase-like amidohydrolase